MTINRLAICAYSKSVEVLAYAIMSTHFHLVVVGQESNVREFISLFKSNITLRHNRNYRANIKLKISAKEVIGLRHTLSVINYVLKNPVHHGVSITPFSYAYSSTHVYFKEELNRDQYFPGEKDKVSNALYLRPCELKSRTQERLFGRQIVPDHFIILENCLVIPDSFISINAVETIYSSPKNFLYYMNRPLSEDIEVFKDDLDSANKHLNKSILTNQISDLKAAQLFDKAILPKTYTEISKEEIENLWNHLKMQGISYAQLQRLL